MLSMSISSPIRMNCLRSTVSHLFLVMTIICTVSNNLFVKCQFHRRQSSSSPSTLFGPGGPSSPDQFSFLAAFHASSSLSSRPSILSESEEDSHSSHSHPSHSHPSHSIGQPAAPTAVYGLSMLNSGPSVSDDEEEEEDEEFKLTSGKDCPTARTEALEAWRNDPSIKLVIPQCTTFGTYQEVQCYDTFCWCVDINKGLPMKGSATPANGTVGGSKPQIDCSNKKDVINRVQKECPVEQKLTFLKLLIQHFEQEMIRNMRNRGEDSPGQGRISNSKETIINWKFNKLDMNRNKVLEKDEWRKFKRQMKRNKAKSVHLGNSTRSMTYKSGQSIKGQSINEGQSSRSGRRRRGRSGFQSGNFSVSESMKAVRKYRHCFKYFFKGCDIEPRDKKVTQEEWFSCTGLYMSEEDESIPPTENPRNDRRRSGSRHSSSPGGSYSGPLGSSPPGGSYSGPLGSSFASRPGHRNPNRDSSVSSSIMSSFTPGIREEISRRRKGGRRKGPNPFSTILKAD